MEEARQLIAGSALLVIDDAGHSAYFEKPAVFNARVLDFLQNVG